MSDMMILGGRRPRGRPRAPKSQVTVRLPETLHDRIASIALAQQVSINTLICRVVAQAVAASPDPIKKVT